MAKTSQPQRDAVHLAWQWLTAPAASIERSAERRQARLLSSMMLILAVLTTTGILSVLLGDSQGTNLSIQIALALVFVVAYFLSRTRRYLWAAALSTFAIAALPFISYLAHGDYSYTASFDSLIWTVVALIFANLFFSTTILLMIILGLLGSVAALPLFIPEIQFSNVFVILTLDLIIGTVVLVNKRYRDLQEQDRQSELSAANLELKSIGNKLEAKVADRTRDLALATEIGRTISQVRQLDDLLANAAELVRDRFELYYVQIYLVDESKSHLVLQAGTGNIGRALVSQGHRLLIGPGSINGQAAIDKKAVVVSDTNTSSIFFANRLLPNTRSELAIPLLITGRVVGVLDLQSEQPNGLTDDNLPAFGALASQLAIAIDNARLFTEVTQARAELEASARVQSSQNWSDFLDAIHHHEHVAFVYESSSATADANLATPDPSENRGTTFSAPISVMGAAVGAIDLMRGPDQPWTGEDRELIAAVSGQVAQRIENLRLLAEAEQYRQEAEKATQRLVREGWQAYQKDTQSRGVGYAYDQDQVTPINPQMAGAGSPAIRRLLSVSGETIGHLDIASTSDDPKLATELAESVARQLSAHIENLRLSQQTEKALATTEQQARSLAELNEMSEALNNATTIKDIFDIAVTHTGQILDVDNTILTLLAQSGEAVEVVAVDGEDSASAVGDKHLIVEGSPLAATIHNKRLATTYDAGKEPAGIAATMMAPVSGEVDVIGTLSVGCERRTSFTPSEEILFQQIAAILGATIERRRLANQVQARADRERILRQITNRVHAAADAESILRTAAVEVSRALGLESFVYLEKEGNGSQEGMSQSNGAHR